MHFSTESGRVGCVLTAPRARFERYRCRADWTIPEGDMISYVSNCHPTPCTPGALWGKLSTCTLRVHDAQKCSIKRMECILLDAIWWRTGGDTGWAGTPASWPLPPHIGKCPRTTCARCGIVSPRNRLTNTIYFTRFREVLREI